MDRFDPFVKYADVYGDIINWEKDPMNKPQNQNKYFFSDGKTYYEQICKMLRLMSVFKEAFNQIYSNEDEISEAWENFVNNLSASVVEGSEPDVTLTWTDDSVNFEFTMVPGVPGEQGVGITSISFNSDYTMTITLSDGNTYTSMSLKGETGPQGPQGETGSGLQILDVYATLADLQSAHPTGQPGDAYQVGSGGNYILYIWSSSHSAWVQAGTLGTVSPYTSAPLMDGTASAGSQNLYARGDHVHPSDTSRASKEELDALIKTSQALIDQSFTYRESPAIQDGLARMDKIKGNTLVWNQLVQNGNFADSSNWVAEGSSTINSVTNNTINVTTTDAGNSGIAQISFPMTNGHKYLLVATIKTTGQTNISVSGIGGILFNTNSFVTKSVVFTWTAATGNQWSVRIRNFDANSATFEAKNVMLIDLTEMGLDISSPSEFTSLFPLSYYSYNQGSLLSFNGNGIKTTGKNLAQNDNATNQNRGAFSYSSETLQSVKCTKTTNGGVFYFKLKARLKANTIYKLSVGDVNVNGNPRVNFYIYSDVLWGNVIYSNKFVEQNSSHTFSFTENYENAVIGLFVSGNTGIGVEVNDIMLTFEDTDTSVFEPYTETITDLPTSAYFTTGMKSAGSVYDELTENKAITRIGRVDLGTLNYDYNAVNIRFQAQMPSNYKIPTSAEERENLLCAKYDTNSNPLQVGGDNGITGYQNSYNIFIRDNAYTDPNTFKASLSGVYLYYELATPTETDVDIDLSFNAYENGTEQLLPVNGSVPSTSPIIADMAYLSIDDAMEYVLEKLSNVPQNTQQILESLEDDVADLQTDVGALQPAVSALQTSVGNINTNIGQLSSTVAGHTASISNMQSDISDLNTGLSNLEDTVTDNTSRIGTLESGLSTTNGNVQNLETSVSDLDDTVTAQGTTVTALDGIIQDISNNPVVASVGSHELGFVAAYVSATLAANTGTKVTIPKPTIFPNNYTPLFIVGMTTGSYNVSICEIPYSFGNRDSVDCRVWNHGGQQTTQITVYILCMRQRQSQ